jgi:hypothetical protein
MASRTSKSVPAVDPAILDLFAAFMAAQQGQHETAIAPKARKGKAATPRGTSARVLNANRERVTTTPSKSTPKVAKGAITCEQAWKALGSDPQYTPSQPKAPARNSQLWALNAKGMIRLV